MTDICFENAVKALYEIQVAEAERLSEQAQHTEILFSERFKAKMQKLIRRREKAYYVLINTVAKRVAIIILAIIITTVSATIGVAAIYQPFADFITQIFEERTRFTSNPNSQTSSIDYLAEWKEYTPSYIPAGFEMNKHSTGAYSSFVNYSNEKGKNFRIIQTMAGGASTSLDTENGYSEYISVNGIEMFYYENKGENHIFFKKGVNFIYLHGTIDKNELINIAISLNFEEK